MKLLVSLTLVSQALVAPIVATPLEQVISEALVQHGGPLDRAKSVSRMIVAQATRWKADPLLVAAVITVENPWLISDTASHAGALGLMQVMPFWTDHLSDTCGPDLTDDWTNLCYGINILHIFYRREELEWEPALLAYNGCKTLERCGNYPHLVMRRRELMEAAAN